jgi:hypothetical protein
VVWSSAKLVFISAMFKIAANATSVKELKTGLYSLECQSQLRMPKSHGFTALTEPYYYTEHFQPEFGAKLIIFRDLLSHRI